MEDLKLFESKRSVRLRAIHFLANTSFVLNKIVHNHKITYY